MNATTILHKNKLYDILHKTTLRETSRYFNQQDIRYEYLVAHAGYLYLADIINGGVVSLSKLTSKPTESEHERMVRDETTNEYLRSYELSRSRARKLALLTHA